MKLNVDKALKLCLFTCFIHECQDTSLRYQSRFCLWNFLWITSTVSRCMLPVSWNTFALYGWTYVWNESLVFGASLVLILQSCDCLQQYQNYHKGLKSHLQIIRKTKQKQKQKKNKKKKKKLYCIALILKFDYLKYSFKGWYWYVFSNFCYFSLLPCIVCISTKQ